MTTLIQFRRGTAAQWASANPTLAEGEMGVVTDTGRYKIGDGATAWNALSPAELSPDVVALNMSATTDPGASDADHITLYAKSVGGRIMPKWVAPSGLDTPVQPLLAKNKCGGLTPTGNVAAATVWGAYTAPTATGTLTLRNVTATNIFTRMRRVAYVSAGTAGQLAGGRVAVAQISVGDGAGLGGFFKVTRFGISDASVVAGARMFVGVSSTTGAPTNVEPSTLTNVIGVGHRAADTTLHLFHGGSTAQTPINLGADFPTNTTNTDVYDLTLFAPPSSSDVHWQVQRLNTGHAASGTIANGGGVALPAPSTLLTYLQAWRTNNATAAAVGLDIMSDYIETDY